MPAKRGSKHLLVMTSPCCAGKYGTRRGLLDSIHKERVKMATSSERRKGKSVLPRSPWRWRDPRILDCGFDHARLKHNFHSQRVHLTRQAWR